MRRRDVPFAAVFFFDAPLAFEVLAPEVPETAAGFFRWLDLVAEVGFAPAPLWVPAAAGEAGFGLRRRRRRFRGGGWSEPAGMSSPAMTCG